jgi:hypothetical protein
LEFFEVNPHLQASLGCKWLKRSHARERMPSF